jgi:hypothetical protein
VVGGWAEERTGADVERDWKKETAQGIKNNEESGRHDRWEKEKSIGESNQGRHGRGAPENASDNELTEQLPYITAGWQNQQYVAPWHIFLSSRP